MQETELKYRLDGPAGHAQLRERLRALSAPRLGEHTEANTIYDRGGELRRNGRVLRLRVLDGGPRGVVTMKESGTVIDGIISRPELEVGVDDADTTRMILEALGYRPHVAYAKRRESWRLDDVAIELDTLLFGHFCEIEGEREAILEAAARLGLDALRPEGRGYLAMAEQQAGRAGPVR